MTYEKIEIPDAMELGKTFPFVLCRSYSDVYLGANNAEMKFDLEEILEARFFSDKMEVRIFQKEGILQGCLIKEDESENCLLRTWKIANEKFGKEITVCYELKADEDGQTYIGGNRLAGWKGVKENV